MASRRRTGCALAAGLALALCGSAAAAEPRALVAFLPGAGGQDLTLVDAFADAGMSVGLVSPTTGGFERGQVPLDISQGTRIPTRLYDADLPPLSVGLLGGAGVVANWDAVRKRAEAAPGDLVPGLLAETLEGAGKRVIYVGGLGGDAGLAPAAADRSGQLARYEAVIQGSAADAIPALWSEGTVVFADLPAGTAGLRVIRQLAKARDALVFVMQAPAGERLRLLPAGMAGGGARGQLRSATTRRDGLIAATDIGPTLLEHMGVAVPDEMQGQEIERVRRADPGELRGLAERLNVVSGRRGPALLGFLAAWLVLVLITRGRAARLGFLAVLWLPAFALLAAALRAGEGVEVGVVAGGSLAAAALCDRTLPWPAAAALPAAVSLGAHTIDLIRGSDLIGQAVTGPNPAGGARFYGVGNELETLLSLTVLLGIGAWLGARHPLPVPRGQVDGDRHRVTVTAFGVGGAVFALLLGAGRLGADVGAVVTLGAGTAAAIVASLPGRPTRRRVALAVAAPLAGIAGLALVDLLTGGDAHLTRSVLGAGDSGDLADVAQRRLEGSLAGLKSPGGVAATALAIGFLAWSASRRERLLAALPTGHALRAGLIGAWFAVVIGALGNDSGPLILWIGAAMLALAALYIRRPPVRGA